MTAMAVVLMLLSVIIELSLATGYTFNADEFKSVSYEVDILNKPILSGETSSGFVLHLASKYGQEYQCNLPDNPKSFEEVKVSNVDHKDEAKNHDISALLKPLANQPCLTKTKDWWTYKFCYGKSIKQYHIEENKLVSPVIVLGVYDSEFDWKSDFNNDVDNLNRARRYHSQYYVNGSKCDLTGATRRAEVRFVCEEGAADFISQVDEPESCQYVIVVNTNRVCPHPLLQPPPTGKPKFITCNPVLSSDNYQMYQKEQEEEQKEMEEVRKQWLAKQEKKLSQMKQENDAVKKKDDKTLEVKTIQDEIAISNDVIEKEETKEIPEVDDKTKFEYYEEEDEKFLKKLDEMELLIADLSKLIDVNDEDHEYEEAFAVFHKIISIVNELNEYMIKVFRPRLNEINKFVGHAKDATQEMYRTLESMKNYKLGDDLGKLQKDLDQLGKLKNTLQGKHEQTKEQTLFYEKLLKKSDSINNRYMAVSGKLAKFNLKLLDKAEEEIGETETPDKQIDKLVTFLKKKTSEMVDVYEKEKVKDKENDQDGVSTLKAEMEMESSEDLKSSEKSDIEEETDKLIAAAAKSAIDAIESSLGVKLMVESVEDEEEESVEDNKYRLVDNSEIQSAINRLLAGDDESMHHLQRLSNLERNYKFVWRNKKKVSHEKEEK